MIMELWVINVNVNFQLISKLLMREWSHLIQCFSVRPHSDLRCCIPLALWWSWLHLWRSWRCQYLLLVWARDSHSSWIFGKTSCYFLLLKIPIFWNAQRPSMTQVLVLVCPSSTISSDRVDAPPCQQDSRDGSPNQQSRHEICQKFYTAGFSGQKDYTLNFTVFQQFWWKKCNKT